MQTVGLDIGGANLKISDGRTRSLSVPFPLWKQPDQLAPTLTEILRTFSDVQRLAVTMTGELADCFRTRTEGVHRILDAVMEAAEHREVLVWHTGGEFLSPDEAHEFPLLVAAANWHALATWAGRLAPQENALLVDIGSTTTDLIPLEQGLPMPLGRTDPERMASGELLYQGGQRTPLIGVAHSVHLGNSEHPLANEVFATMWDVLLLLGELPEQVERLETANGRPATIAESRIRLARQLCGDTDVFTVELLGDVAFQLRQAWDARLRAAITRVCGERAFNTWILSGGCSGLFPRDLVASRDVVHDLHAIIGDVHSAAACAFSLARLGMEVS